MRTHYCSTRTLGARCLALGLAAAALLATARPAGAIHGIEGTFDYAIDAPWRIEPYIETTGADPVYGPLPIVIAIHDAIEVGRDPALEPDINLPTEGDAGEWLSLGNFCDLTVQQEGEVPKTYDVADLAEIEATRGRWPWPATPTDIPEHSICRGWAGESCTELADLSETSEWHGLIWHRFEEEPRSGTFVDLDLKVRVTRYPEVGCAAAEQQEGASPTPLITLRNHVRVYFAEEALPRFGEDWLYGDLHYHSQGTDNEGESAYSYRAVARALGAMGMDFVVASDHASDSGQIVDADIYLAPNFEFVDYFTADDVLRDMNVFRFGVARDLIHGETGANREAAVERDGGVPQSVLSHRVVPQVLLGGEVDAIPEVAPGWAHHEIEYGNGLSYDVDQRLCGGFHANLADFGCDTDFLWTPALEGVLVSDIQGYNSYLFGREHLIYLPVDDRFVREDVPGRESCVQCEVGEDGRRLCETVECSTCLPSCSYHHVEPGNAFVSSKTGRFGGASRRLLYDQPGAKGLLGEIEKKGFTFLAHPLNAPGGSEGPEGPPWSRHMLRQAWRSPAVLGLQAWNENTRRRSEVGEQFGGVFEYGYERDEGIKAPKPANTIRFGMVVGGFALRPWDLGDGSWQDLPKGVDQQLKHGTYTWDLMNLWGLDPGQTEELAWLGEGEPRRMFLAGGSDAHGDLNYRREGYFLGAEAITDTAIGSPRNLVYVGAGGSEVVVEGLPDGPPARVYEHSAIVAALAAGSFSVTDGPALRIVVDLDGDGLVDEDDAPMGGLVDLGSEGTLPLLVQWKSTPEFGAVSSIDLYLGVHGEGKGRVYTPYYHDPGNHWDGLPLPAGAYDDDKGRRHEQLNDGYWHVARSSNTRLRIAGGPPGPDVPLCDIQYKVCGVGGDQGPTLGPNDCIIDHQVDACSVCGEPIEDPNISIEQCPATGTFWPGVEPALDEEQWQGLEAVNLDLSAFQATQGVPGTRFFVRAVARTHRRVKGAGGCDTSTGDCITRYAYTNPIWVLSDGEAGEPPPPMCRIKSKVCVQIPEEEAPEASGASGEANLGSIGAAAGALPDGCQIVTQDGPCSLCDPWLGPGTLEQCEDIPSAQ